MAIKINPRGPVCTKLPYSLLHINCMNLYVCMKSGGSLRIFHENFTFTRNWQTLSEYCSQCYTYPHARIWNYKEFIGEPIRVN